MAPAHTPQKSGNSAAVPTEDSPRVGSPLSGRWDLRSSGAGAVGDSVRDAAIAAAVELSRAGLTQQEIGRRLGVWGRTVCVWLKEVGEPHLQNRRRVLPKRKQPSELEKAACVLRRSGSTYVEIGIRLSRTPEWARQVINRWAPKLPTQKRRLIGEIKAEALERKRNEKAQTRAERTRRILELRAAGWKQTDIAKELNCAQTVVSKTLIRAGLRTWEARKGAAKRSAGGGR